jgi:hypothetical protein
MRKPTSTPTRIVQPTGKLAGITEVAEICGVTARSASTYSLRSDFPQPLDYLSVGPIWRASQVERWADKTLPLQPGRPSKQD